MPADTLKTLRTIEGLCQSAESHSGTRVDFGEQAQQTLRLVSLEVKRLIARLEQDSTPVTREGLIEIGGKLNWDRTDVRFYSLDDRCAVCIHLKEGQPPLWLCCKDKRDPFSLPAALAPQTMNRAIEFLLGMGVVLTVSTPPEVATPRTHEFERRKDTITRPGQTEDNSRRPSPLTEPIP